VLIYEQAGRTQGLHGCGRAVRSAMNRARMAAPGLSAKGVGVGDVVTLPPVGRL
jgi:hypothetical protein